MPHAANPRAESDHFLHQAIVAGETDVVIDYLGAGGSANVLDRYQCEPLFTAVKYDRLRIAKLLLTAGGDIHHCSPFRGDALAVACWNWNVRMIHFCLRAGAEINRLHEGQTNLDAILQQVGRFPPRKTTLRRWQTTHDALIRAGAKRAAEL